MRTLKSDNILRRNRITKMTWSGETAVGITHGKEYKITKRRLQKCIDESFRYFYTFVDDLGNIREEVLMTFSTSKRTK
jgi:hypothetical protein